MSSKSIEQYDKAGSVWKLDKQKKKFLREKVSTILDKIWNQGFYSAYKKGDQVAYDNGCKYIKAEIIEVYENEYKLKTEHGNVVVASEDNIISMEEIYE